MNSSDLRADLAAIAELIQPGERVLDLGCGDGILLKYLVDTHKVVGRGIEAVGVWCIGQHATWSQCSTG